jgi:hypothetical protein
MDGHGQDVVVRAVGERIADHHRVLLRRGRRRQGRGRFDLDLDRLPLLVEELDTVVRTAADEHGDGTDDLPDRLRIDRLRVDVNIALRLEGPDQRTIVDLGTVPRLTAGLTRRLLVRVLRDRPCSRQEAAQQMDERGRITLAGVHLAQVEPRFFQLPVFVHDALAERLEPVKTSVFRYGRRCRESAE